MKGKQFCECITCVVDAPTCASTEVDFCAGMEMEWFFPFCSVILNDLNACLFIGGRGGADFMFFNNIQMSFSSD